ncbi:MAG: DUF116 domain-containing protein [Nitrospirota bacterium]|nr:DUF116 domain-containing protein [Nitrospirota bacterium]
MSQKRLFITILFSTVAVMFLLALGLWFIPATGLVDVSSLLPKLVGAVIVIFLFLITLGSGLLAYALTTRNRIFLAQPLRGVVLKFLYPMMVPVAKIFGVSRDRVQQGLVEINNILVKACLKPIKPEKLLLMMPHCLQFHECDRKITTDVYNCVSCGRCDIMDLLKIAKKYNVHLSVATGGTLARKILKERRPHAIIAVACERDMTSGLQDSFPLPVLGYLLDRPNGPCFDTKIDYRKVGEAMLYFASLGKDDKQSSEEPAVAGG